MADQGSAPDPPEVVTHRMFYTACTVCGALNDWTDTPRDAARNRRAHARWHRRHPGQQFHQEGDPHAHR